MSSNAASSNPEPPQLNSPSESSPARRSLLRHRDQVALALLVVAALVWCCIAWVRSGGPTGHLVDADRRLAEKPDHAEAIYQVDVNSADVAELGELPQVGPMLARRLIEYREQHGPFRTADELLKVPGIGPKTLAAMRPHVRFR